MGPGTKNPHVCGGQAPVLLRTQKTLPCAPEWDGTEYLSRKVSRIRLLLSSSREDARLLGRRNAKCKHALVEGCEDLQKQRRAVEGEV